MKNEKNLKKAKVNGGVSMSLYELNQDIIKSMPMADAERLAAIKDEINAFDSAHKNIHYMFLCNELHYYTIFEGIHIGASEFASLGSAVISLIEEMEKQIVTADAFEGRYEIWLKDENDEPHVYLLFPYDKGVVTYGA